MGWWLQSPYIDPPTAAIPQSCPHSLFGGSSPFTLITRPTHLKVNTFHSLYTHVQTKTLMHTYINFSALACPNSARRFQPSWSTHLKVNPFRSTVHSLCAFIRVTTLRHTYMTFSITACPKWRYFATLTRHQHLFINSFPSGAFVILALHSTNHSTKKCLAEQK